MRKSGRTTDRRSASPRRRSETEQILIRLDELCDERQASWHDELHHVQPNWGVLLALHLQLSELEHLRLFLYKREASL